MRRRRRRIRLTLDELIEIREGLDALVTFVGYGSFPNQTAEAASRKIREEISKRSVKKVINDRNNQ